MEGDELPPAPPLPAAAAAATGLGMAPFPDPDIPGPSDFGGGGGEIVAPGVHVTQQVNYPQQGGGGHMVAPGVYVTQQVNYLEQPNQPRGGGQMVAPGVHAEQQVNYLEQPNQHNYQQGGGGQMVAPGVHVAPQVNYPEHGHQIFDSRHVAHLHEHHQYVDMENYVMGFLPQGETWITHPWLLFHIRRAWAIAYVQNGHFDAARTFFSQNIEAVFQPILELNQGVVRNAMITDLASEIDYIRSCVTDEICHTHIYTGDGMLEKLINDYLMLYLPNTMFTTEKKTSTGLWQLAVELGRKHRRPTFRCLVCSVEVFICGTIGDMVQHLQEGCAGPKTTPFLMDKYPHCGVKIAPGQPTVATIQERLEVASRKKEQSRKRSRTTATEDVPGETLESILQSMATQMKRAHKLSADVGVISVQMDQVVSSMKGLLSAAEAAAGTGARESQLIIAAPSAQVAPASTSVTPIGTFTPTPDDDLFDYQELYD